MADLRDFTGKNRRFTGAAGVKVSDDGLASGDRVNEKGRLRFNDTTDLLEYYTGVEWKSIDAPPVLTSINIDGAGAVTSGVIDSSLSGNSTIVIAGSLFDPNNATVLLEAASGSNITPTTTTNDSSNQITIAVPYSSFVNANEPYTVKVTNPSGLSAQLEQAINVDTTPTFTNAVNTNYDIYDSARSSVSISAAALAGATDTEGDTLTYSISAGALPTGLTIASATGVISGSTSAVGSDTVSTFTVQVAQTGGGASSTRQFTITQKAPQAQSFTSLGAFTFNTPVGTSAVDVLVIGGGGGAEWGGGGAGGMIYRPAFPVTPGSPIPGNIGDGGGNGQNQGQDSAFSTLTAKGGGYGGNHGPSSPANGNPGGSGGGVGRDGGPGGSGGGATQPGQPGDSGNYGHGNPGGPNPHGMSGWQGAGGGGGAGGTGQPGSPHHPGDESGGPGGSGRANSITGSSVTYAGGGGGGTHPSGGRPAGSAGPGGGGTGGKGTTGGQGSDGQGGGGGGGSPGGTGGSGVVIVRF